MAEMSPEAQERYLALVAGLDAVQEGLDEITRLIKRSFVGIEANWRSKSRREMQALREKAQDALDDFRDIAKKYETEMVAKGWRA